MTYSVRSTVVLVTWRGHDHLAGCLTALAGQTRAHRVVVVDNASTDGSRRIAEKFSTGESDAEESDTGRLDVTVLRLPRNVGYAGALAEVPIDTEFVCWLNDDTVPGPGWLAALEDAMDADPRAAAAGATLTDADGTPRSRGIGLTPNGYGRDVTSTTPFGFCGGAAIVRAHVLRAIGGVPAEYFCYYEDTDVSWRLRLAGWSILSVAAARVVHAHGASSSLGSAAFHRWNERNRLWTLVRCAPLWVVARELLRFAAITALLPVRRIRGDVVPAAPNFEVGLRSEVLLAVIGAVPRLLAQRRAITGRSSVERTVLWRRWAHDNYPTH